MATYYQPASYRGPILAEDALPDFREMQRQTELGAEREQEQLRRAGEQTADRYRAATEEGIRAMQAPLKGYEAYQQARDVQARRQAQAEESAARKQALAAGEREAARDVKWGDRRTQADIAQMEAGAQASQAGVRLAETQAKRAEFETASLEKWAQPGSAAKLIPGAAAVITQYNLPNDISAEEFIKSAGAKLDIDTAKRAEQSFQNAQSMFPLQLKALGQQISMTAQQAQQGQYTFDRQQLQDRVSDAATTLASLRMRSEQDANAAKQYDQSLASMDPKTRGLVEGEINARLASKRLQDALAEPTLDPVKYAGKQKTVEDYMMVNDTAKTVNHLIGLVNQYKKASTLFWDNEEAEALRGEIANIAAEAGYPNLSEDILSGVTSGAMVDTTMNRLISIIGGKAMTAARSANAAPETVKLAESIRQSLATMKIRETNGMGKVTSQGLLDIANKKGKGLQKPQQIPTQQTPFSNPGKYQQNYQQQNRRVVPPAKGG